MTKACVLLGEGHLTQSEVIGPATSPPGLHDTDFNSSSSSATQSPSLLIFIAQPTQKKVLHLSYMGNFLPDKPT